MDRIELDDIERLRSALGPDRSARVLSALGRHTPLIEALSTDVGKEILNTALNKTKDLLERIVNEQATDLEKAEYRVLRIILGDWSGRINNYYKLHETVVKGK